MTTRNPFPGMNLFFEQRWRDAHTRLITYLHDALQERLPRDLVVGAEGEIVTIGARERVTTYRPDLQVREPSMLKEPAAVELAPPPPKTTATEPIRLRDRLPAIRVPLRPGDTDVVLDLQPLIDQGHERGRYHLLNYRLELDPPLPPDDALWVDQILREHGLR